MRFSSAGAAFVGVGAGLAAGDDVCAVRCCRGSSGRPGSAVVRSETNGQRRSSASPPGPRAQPPAPCGSPRGRPASCAGWRGSAWWQREPLRRAPAPQAATIHTRRSLDPRSSIAQPPSQRTEEEQHCRGAHQVAVDHRGAGGALRDNTNTSRTSAASGTSTRRGASHTAIGTPIRPPSTTGSFQSAPSMSTPRSRRSRTPGCVRVSLSEAGAVECREYSGLPSDDRVGADPDQPARSRQGPGTEGVCHSKSDQLQTPPARRTTASRRHSKPTRRGAAAQRPPGSRRPGHRAASFRPPAPPPIRSGRCRRLSR